MNKKRSNEYGFTLVELLVAIAIMLSITVLAIVNIVGVSNRKKEEAWVSVKEEIETAATDYFKANEYLFEGLGDTGYGVISVGRLVESDYLNKVTDPRTGKAVSYCTKVNVSKKGRSVSVTSVDEINSSATACDTESLVKVSNAKNAPDLKITSKCNQDKNNTWCKAGVNPEVKATATPVSGSEVAKLETNGCDSNSGLSGDTTKTKTCYITNETSGKTLTFTATSADGGITKINTTIKYDKTAPKVDLTIASNNKNYKTKNTKISVVVKETLSHVASVNSFVGGDKKDIFGNKTSEYSKDSFILKNENYLLFDKYSGTSKTVKVTAKDTAGNEGSSSKSYTVYKECQTGFTSTTDTITKKCPSSSCSNNKETETVKTITTDNYTSKECSTNTSYNDCNLKKCCPTFKYDEYGKKNDFNSNAWYTKVNVKYDGDSSYWSWNNNSCKGNNCTINSLGKDKTVTLNGKKGESCTTKKVNIYEKFDCSNNNITVTTTSEAVAFTINNINGEFDYTINSIDNTFLYSGSSRNKKATRSFDRNATQSMKYKLNGYDKNDIPFECSGTIERPIDPPVCPTNPDSVIGTEGNNGWYKSDVTIKFNGHNSVKEYYWVTRHNNKISDPIKNKNLEIKVEGTTSYMLYVSNGYKTISCGGWKDIKIDKTAPKFKGADYNIYIKQTSSAQKGVGYVYLAGYLTTRNICMKNTSGYIHFDIPNPIYEDSISGVAHYTIENLLSTDPNVFSRPNTPKTYRIKYSAEDNAGNVSGISYSDTFTVAYILNSSSNQSYSPCYLGNYKNIFKTDGFIDDGKNYNLNASS